MFYVDFSCRFVSSSVLVSSCEQTCVYLLLSNINVQKLSKLDLVSFLV